MSSVRWSSLLALIHRLEIAVVKEADKPVELWLSALMESVQPSQHFHLSAHSLNVVSESGNIYSDLAMQLEETVATIL